LYPCDLDKLGVQWVRTVSASGCACEPAPGVLDPEPVHRHFTAHGCLGEPRIASPLRVDDCHGCIEGHTNGGRLDVS